MPVVSTPVTLAPSAPWVSFDSTPAAAFTTRVSPDWAASLSSTALGASSATLTLNVPLALLPLASVTV